MCLHVNHLLEIYKARIEITHITIFQRNNKENKRGNQKDSQQA